MTDIVADLQTVRARITVACAAAGRDSSEVRLLPVSKTMGTDKILALYAAGETMFGENLVQEAEAKAAELAETKIRWSMIGHLQTNKARNLARFADEFQALDSLRVAAELDKRLQAENRAIDVLVQVNSSAEPQKFGLPPEEVEAFAEQLGPYSSLRVKGLMTLAVFSDDPAVVQPCFVRMTELRDRLRANDRAVGSWDELSMGMSGDFELAIAEGSTCVRVGQAIFGARPNPNVPRKSAR
jgi:PLP dependent protein